MSKFALMVVVMLPEAVYERYAQDVRRIVRHAASGWLLLRLEVDDLTQEAFLAFLSWPAHSSLPDHEVWPVLCRIALNRVRGLGDFHSRVARDARKTESIDRVDVPSIEGMVLSGLIVQETLDRLSDTERAIVELRMSGHEVAEIARVTGRSMRSVERTLHKLKRESRYVG